MTAPGARCNAQVVHYVVERALLVHGSRGYRPDMPPVTIAMETARARLAHLLKANM